MRDWKKTGLRDGKGKSHILEGTGSNPTQSTLRRMSEMRESPIIWSLKLSKSPCFPDSTYRMGAANLRILELKGGVGKEAT
jgi:hypothetical protein